jgi:F-type H+-transporting ATPase subunit alpha
MSVEKQIAIIYCGTNGLLSGIPATSVKEFETDFLEFLDLKHKDVLADLALGKLSDQITDTLEKVAKEIAEKFS